MTCRALATSLKPRKSFLKDLKNCKAIIATAGFTLISEALFLGKPYFALPLKGQFEQTLNALCLKQAGFGDFVEIDEINEKKILDFLKTLDKYEEKLKNYKPDYDKLYKVLDKILKRVEKE